MSDIKILERKAMEIHQRYSDLEKKNNRQPWDAGKLANGFKKDVTDLIHILEQQSLDERKLNHELGDCLWSVLVIARRLNVDIEKAFWTTMGELDNRLNGALS